MNVTKIKLMKTKSREKNTSFNSNGSESTREVLTSVESSHSRTLPRAEKNHFNLLISTNIMQAKIFIQIHLCYYFNRCYSMVTYHRTL